MSVDLIVEALQSLKVPIDSVRPDPQNVRQHPEPNRKAIAKSLQGFQQRKPIVVNKRTMTIEAGNGLWQEMKTLGATEIAVVFVEDTDEQAKAFGIMDNRSAELAVWDMPSLKDELLSLDTGAFDMDLTGFDSKALEELMTWTQEPTRLTALSTDVPPALTWLLVGVPTTRFGEIAADVEHITNVVGITIKMTVADK